MATEQQLTALRNAVVNYIERVNNRVVPLDFHIVDNDDDLAALQGTEQSFEDVFNNWTRFSRHYNYGYTNTANPSELNTWSYLPNDNLIRNNTNSDTYIGFISPTLHDKYSFEVTMKSNVTDDDFIGLVLATAMDEQGRMHTLDLVCCGNGISPIMIARDFWVETDASGGAPGSPPNTDNPFTLKAATDIGLVWIDGTTYTGAIKSSSSAQNWVHVPNGMRVKAVRDGDVFTVYCSPFNGTTLIATPALVLDLNSDPRLAIFKGPQRFGYSAASQANSTWEVHSRPGAREPIYDIRTNTHYEWNGEEWESTAVAYPEIDKLPQDRSFYFSPQNKKLFYYDSRVGLLSYNDYSNAQWLSSASSESLIGTAAVARQGVVLAYGCGSSGYSSLQYDPFTDTWSSKTNFIVPTKWGIPATSESIDHVYVTAGETYSIKGQLNVNWDTGGSWSSLSNECPRTFHNDNTIGSGRYMSGQIVGDWIYLNTREYISPGVSRFSLVRYNMDTGVWEDVFIGDNFGNEDSIPEPTLLHDGRLVSVRMSALKFYDPSSMVFTTASPPLANHGVGYVQFIHKEKIYVLGGTGVAAHQNRFSVYDINATTWSVGKKFHNNVVGDITGGRAVYVEPYAIILGIPGKPNNAVVIDMRKYEI